MNRKTDHTAQPMNATGEHEALVIVFYGLEYLDHMELFEEEDWQESNEAEYDDKICTLVNISWENCDINDLGKDYK